MSARSTGYEAIVVGASAGAMPVIHRMVLELPGDYPLAVLIVQHRADSYDAPWIERLDKLAAVRVKEADEKEAIAAGTVYLAPGNYHMLVESDRTLSFSMDERVNHARPSIDVLFETAAQVYGNRLVGVVLSGGNDDGARGLRYIRERGGLTIVQDPRSAHTPSMPEAAIRMAAPDHVLEPSKLVALLLDPHLLRVPGSNEPHLE